MSVDWIELRKGLTETRQYILSHHDSSELYRCYAPVVFGRRVHICARCSGIYPGIITGILSYFFLPPTIPQILLVGILPLPALIDWTLTALKNTEGYNLIRTMTGALLGSGYGLGIALILFQSEVSIFLIGGIYACIAGILLSKKESIEA